MDGEEVMSELYAMPPDFMRDLVEFAINQHLNQDELRILKIAEENERQLITTRIGGAA
jgi:hypothetical protein